MGNNSGTLQFNHVTANTPGEQIVTIWYTDGDAVRYAFLSMNGGAGTPVSFWSTGSFQTVGSIQRTVTLNAGSNNTLEFYNPIVGSWAADVDRIGVNRHITPATDLRPEDLFSWSSPSVRNLTLNGSRYFSIDSGSLNIVSFNQTPPGDFGDCLSAFGPTLAAGWGLRGAADCNRDGHPDYGLFAPRVSEHIALEKNKIFKKVLTQFRVSRQKGVLPMMCVPIHAT